MKTILILITLFLIIKFGIPFAKKIYRQYKAVQQLRSFTKAMSDGIQKKYGSEQFIVPNNLSESQNLDPKWNKGGVRGKNGRFMKKENNG
ncbi:MAG TPA: hypothetical protein DEG69_20145 [Flavobacteriaceae bacterium]|nr:hypothetical protein [Flavobacteriaceae bacterium]